MPGGVKVSSAIQVSFAMLLSTVAVVLFMNVDEKKGILSEERVLRELQPNRLDAEDLYGPNARSFGVPFLIDCGERCHDGLFAILDQVEKKKLRVNKGVNMQDVFTVLNNQRCDRSRFLTYAEKYALTDRGETKLTEEARREAVNLLGQIGTPDHAEKLIPLLQDQEKCIRKEALAAIRKLGDRRHAQLVLDQLSAPRPNLPPLTDAETKEFVAAWKELSVIPPPETLKDKSGK